MSTHISGLRLDRSDRRTDTEVTDALAVEMRVWLLATRAREIGSSLHHHALAARFGSEHALAANEVIDEWHDDAQAVTGTTYGKVSAVLHRHAATGERYLSFFGPGALFSQSRDNGLFGADFSYHNSSDAQLDEMTEAEWRHRRDTWDELIPSGFPNRHGQTVAVSIDRSDPLTPDFTDTERIGRARQLAIGGHLVSEPFPRQGGAMEEFELRMRAARRVVDDHADLFGTPTQQDHAGGLSAADVQVLRESVNREYAAGEGGDW